MGFRALDFSKAHPDSSAGYTTALARLEELIGKADGIATKQRAGVIAERTATARKREIRATLHKSMLRHVARVAEGASLEQPELIRKFRLQPGNSSYQSFRTAARAMAAEAVAQKELLVRHGLSEPLLDGLVQSLDKFEEAVQQGAAGRNAHVGASAELAAVVQDVVLVVRVMDGLNRFRFAHDAESLAGWESASNVFGPSQPVDEAPVDPGPEGDDGSTPTAPDQIQPAA